MDDIVYRSTFEDSRDANLACWYLAFCLETLKLQNLLYTKADDHVHPYIMPWPTYLISRRRCACGNVEPV
ncbi:hypothetical protein ACP70R_033025 [Stipagrostis hirtigluma subsp. patula]